MIRKSEPLSMPEVLEYLDKKEEKEAELIGFVKKFTKLNAKEAKEMKKKIEDLDLIQIKDEHLVKIIDVMPENLEDLNKILSGISLDEDETKKILEIVKEFR
jgi:DNA-directed RNA polymerase subunit F